MKPSTYQLARLPGCPGSETLSARWLTTDGRAKADAVRKAVQAGADIPDEIPLIEMDCNGKVRALADLRGIDFSGLKIGDVDLAVCCFDSANFSGTELDCTSFQYSSFRNVDFSGTKWNAVQASPICADGASFQSAQLASSFFMCSYLADANFDGAAIEKADFSGSDLGSAKLSRARSLSKVNITQIFLSDEEEGLALQQHGGVSGKFWVQGAVVTAEGCLTRPTGSITVADAKAVSLGAQDALLAILKWRDTSPGEEPFDATKGALQLWLRDTLIWGERDASGQVTGITWCWITLLEFLAQAWPYLANEQQYPINFAYLKEPGKLFQFLAAAKQHIRNPGNVMADQESAQLQTFRGCHDLSAALQGKLVPALLLLRRGNQMLAGTGEREFVLSYPETMKTLKALGDAIAGRIAWLEDERSRRAFKCWQERDAAPNAQILHIATTLPDALLRKVWPFDVDTLAANDPRYDGLKAVARMAGNRVPENVLRKILLEVSTISQKVPLASEQLRTLWIEAADCVAENSSLPPAASGYHLATLLRQKLNCANGRVDPELLLKKWGVSVRDVDMPDSVVDAIAVWREKQCATVLVNKGGLRAHLPTGRRSTLAHEICHILVDLDGALPAAEVLGGNVPKEIEQRANAFAAEFLLPQFVAAKLVMDGLAYMSNQNQRLKELEAVTRSLSEEYEVSDEIIAWQILKSEVDLNEEDKKFLLGKAKSIHAPY